MESRHVCLTCLEYTTLACGCCKAVHYCSKVCQESDFVYHKHEVDEIEHTGDTDSSSSSSSFGNMDVENGTVKPLNIPGRRKLIIKESARDHAKKMDVLRKELHDYEELMKSSTKSASNNASKTAETKEGIKQALVKQMIKDELRRTNEDGLLHLNRLREIAEVFKKPFDTEVVMSEFYAEFIRRKQKLALEYTIATMKSDKTRLVVLHKQSDELKEYYVEKVYHGWLLKDMVLVNPDLNDKVNPREVRLSDLLRKKTRKMNASAAKNTADALFDVTLHRAGGQMDELFKQRNKQKEREKETEFSRKRQADDDVYTEGVTHKQNKPDFRAFFGKGGGTDGADQGMNVEPVPVKKTRGRPAKAKKKVAGKKGKETDEAVAGEEKIPYNGCQQYQDMKETGRIIDNATVDHFEKVMAESPASDDVAHEKVKKMTEDIVENGIDLVKAKTTLLAKLDPQVDTTQTTSFLERLKDRFVGESKDPSLFNIAFYETDRWSKSKAALAFIGAGCVLPLLFMFVLRMLSAPLGQPASMEDIDNTFREQTEIIQEYATEVNAVVEDKMNGILEVTNEWMDRSAKSHLCRIAVPGYESVGGVNTGDQPLMIDSGAMGDANDTREAYIIFLESIKDVEESLEGRTGLSGYEVGTGLASIEAYIDTGSLKYLRKANEAFWSLRNIFSKNTLNLGTDVCVVLEKFARIQNLVASLAIKLRGLNHKLVIDMTVVGEKFVKARDAYDNVVKGYRFVKAPFVESLFEYYGKKSLLSPNLAGGIADAWFVNGIGSSIMAQAGQMAMSLEETTNTLYSTLTEGDRGAFLYALLNDNMMSLIRLSDLTNLVYASMLSWTLLGYTLKYMPFLGSVGAIVAGVSTGSLYGAAAGGAIGGLLGYTIGPVRDVTLSLIRLVNSFTTKPEDLEIDAIVRGWVRSTKADDVKMAEAVERLIAVAPSKTVLQLVGEITSALTKKKSMSPLSDWTSKVIECIELVPEGMTAVGRSTYALQVLFWLKATANGLWMRENWANVSGFVSGLDVLGTMSRFIEIGTTLVYNSGILASDVTAFMTTRVFFVSMAIFGSMVLLYKHRESGVVACASYIMRSPIKFYQWALWNQPMLVANVTISLLLSLSRILVPLSWESATALLETVGKVTSQMGATTYVGDKPNIIPYDTGMNLLRTTLNTTGLDAALNEAKATALLELNGIYTNNTFIKGISWNMATSFPLIQEIALYNTDHLLGF